MAQASIAGAIVGGLMGIANGYAQNRALKKQNELAEKQYEAAKQAYQNEEQERAKANGKEVDVDQLLSDNTYDRPATDLTGGKVKQKLYKPVTALGGSNVK